MSHFTTLFLSLYLSVESSLGDEWEKDFDDIEITEEDIKNAQLASKNKTLDADDESDEWENWD